MRPSTQAAGITLYIFFLSAVGIERLHGQQSQPPIQKLFDQYGDALPEGASAHSARCA